MCSTRQTGSIGAACDAGANPSNLLDAIDGLFAYDSGGHDSGISDQKLKHEVVSHLTGLTGGTRRVLVARYRAPILNGGRYRGRIWDRRRLQLRPVARRGRHTPHITSGVPSLHALTYLGAGMYVPSPISALP